MGLARSLSDCVETFLLWLGKRAKPGTVNFYRIYLRRFVSAMEDKPIDEVRRLDVECWTAERNPLVCLTRFFRWAADVGEYLPKNPLATVKVPKVGERTRTLMHAERVIVRRNCNKSLYRAILALEETACRPQEMRILTWEMIEPKPGPAQIAVNLADGRHWFQLAEYKGKDRRKDTREPRIIAITPRLGRLLDRLRRRKPDECGVVFVGPNGRAWTANAFRCAFRRVRQRLDEAGKVDAKGFVPYTYRHTRATAIARDIKNPLLLKRWMGHSKIETTAKYCHMDEQDVLAIGRRPWK